MCVWICVRPLRRRRRCGTHVRPVEVSIPALCASGSPSRSAGSSIWMIAMPARSRVDDFIADRQRDLQRRAARG
jgi:hypothetical protein